MQPGDSAVDAGAAQDAILNEALARFEATPDPRLRAVVLSLIRHLHAFARETGLTWAEWERGMSFLAKAASVSDESRNEFIALSDGLGLTMQVLATSQPKPAGATSPTLIGPFFLPNAPEFENGADVSSGASGEPLFARGRVLDTRGRPLARAVIDVWQSDDRGLYDVQDNFDGTNMWARARLRADAEGRYSFWSVMPTAYPAPTDAALGDLVMATTKKYWRPAHLHFALAAEGADPLVTHLFVSDSLYLDEDFAFGVRPDLVADFVARGPGTAPDGRIMDRPFRTLEYDFVLTRGGA